MPWVVVKFLINRDGDSFNFTTIPSSWISKVGDENYALYPPDDISEAEVKRLVCKGDEPNDDWDLLRVKYVTPNFDSVAEALDFAGNAAELSEIDLEVFAKTGTIGKRKRKAKDIRYPSEPVSSEDEDVVILNADPLSATCQERKTESSKSYASPKKIALNPVGKTSPGLVQKIIQIEGKTYKVISQSIKVLSKKSGNPGSSRILPSNVVVTSQSGHLKDLVKIIPVPKLDEPMENSSSVLTKKTTPMLFNDTNVKEFVKVIPVHKLVEPQACTSGLQSKMPSPKQYTNKASMRESAKTVPAKTVNDLQSSSTPLQDIMTAPISDKNDDVTVKDEVTSVKKEDDTQGNSRSLLKTVHISEKCDVNNMKVKVIQKVDEIQGTSTSLFFKKPIAEKCDENNLKIKVIPTHKLTALQTSSLGNNMPFTPISDHENEKGSCSETIDARDIIKYVSIKKADVPQASTMESSTPVPEESNEAEIKEVASAYKECKSSSSSSESDTLIEQYDEDSMMDPLEGMSDHNEDDIKGITSIVPDDEPAPEISDDADVKDLIKSFEWRVTQQMASIMNKISALEQGMKTISDKLDWRILNPNASEDFSDCADLFLLPVDSLEELISLQRKIASCPKYRRYMLKTLKDYSAALVCRGLGVKDISSSLNRTVYSCLATIMTNGVGMTLCMKGKSAHKVSFESHFSQLISLIHDVVKEKNVNGPEIDICILKRSMGEWFRLARLRQYNGRPSRTLLISEEDVKTEDENDTNVSNF